MDKPGGYGKGFDDTTLLNCPFCGGKAYTVPSGNGTVIRCGDCTARVVSNYGPVDAANYWNKRNNQV